MPVFSLNSAPRDEPHSSSRTTRAASQSSADPLLAFRSEAGDDPAEDPLRREFFARLSSRARQALEQSPSRFRSGDPRTIRRWTAVAIGLAAVIAVAALALPATAPALPDWHVAPVFTAPPSLFPTLVPANWIDLSREGRVGAAHAPAASRDLAHPSRGATRLPAASARAHETSGSPAAAVAMGRLSINAKPWADVWVDGQLVGTTPLANLRVPVGGHEVLWRHPQLGERRATVHVGTDTPARSAVDLRTP
ncbi:MAG: hypothetical protein ABIW19_14480 [Vicinamibacterales bacterium]